MLSLDILKLVDSATLSGLPYRSFSLVSSRLTTPSVILCPRSRETYDRHPASGWGVPSGDGAVRRSRQLRPVHSRTLSWVSTRRLAQAQYPQHQTSSSFAFSRLSAALVRVAVFSPCLALVTSSPERLRSPLTSWSAILRVVKTTRLLRMERRVKIFAIAHSVLHTVPRSYSTPLLFVSRSQVWPPLWSLRLKRYRQVHTHVCHYKRSGRGLLAMSMPLRVW